MDENSNGEKKVTFNIFTSLIYTFCEIKEEEGTNFPSVLFDELVFQCWIPFLTPFPWSHSKSLTTPCSFRLAYQIGDDILSE